MCSNISYMYKENHLRPNPAKTQLTAFHLKNRHADRKRDVTWNGTKLDLTHTPVYLGITLDRSLTYWNLLPLWPCLETRAELSSRNNLPMKLHGTNWSVSPHHEDDGDSTTSLRGELAYCCPLWARSTHRKLVDTTPNETYRLIMGCISPTATPDLCVLSVIAPIGNSHTKQRPQPVRAHRRTSRPATQPVSPPATSFISTSEPFLCLALRSPCREVARTMGGNR